ncbi:MAG: ribosome small subunit-dependent GTPase A [Fusobacteriota bacterium]
MIIKGRILNKSNGFYYVEEIKPNNENEIDNYKKNIYECKLRGRLKKNKNSKNCMTGDLVKFSPELKIIEKVLKRKNYLIRPLVANVDKLIITISAKDPKLDLNTLNLLILNSFYYKVKPVVLINKIDLLSENELVDLKEDLKFLKAMDINYYFTSINSKKSLNHIYDELKDSIIVFGGPSGVGKSSILNLIQSKKELKIGSLNKQKRGKHTTTTTTLIKVKNLGYVIDTPGFTAIEIPNIQTFQEFSRLFPRIHQLSKKCKFNDCRHTIEPKCEVQKQVENGNLSKIRYDFYSYILKKIQKRWENYYD